jgi:PTS system nitrogen regulatory IIA component
VTEEGGEPGGEAAYMNLGKILSEDLVRIGLKGATKPDILRELVDVLYAAGRVHDREAALRAIEEREAKMSTGMQQGLALPHARCDVVDRLVAVIGIKPEGVDFQSVDGEPSRIFVLTLSPLNRTGPHIQFLAEIGRLINRPEIRQRLLEAKTPAEAIRILCQD